MKRNFTPEDVKRIEAEFDKVYEETRVKNKAIFDKISIDWTPEEDEAFNEVEKQSNLGKQILQEIKPQREWVGLTDEEIWTVLQFRGYSKDNIEIAKAIEAKLKQKNGYAEEKNT